MVCRYQVNFTLFNYHQTHQTFSAKKDPSQSGPQSEAQNRHRLGRRKKQSQHGVSRFTMVRYDKDSWCGGCLEQSCQRAQGGFWWAFSLSSLTERITPVCEDWIIFKPFLYWQKVCWSGYICMCLGTWVPEWKLCLVGNGSENMTGDRFYKTPCAKRLDCKANLWQSDCVLVP